MTTLQERERVLARIEGRTLIDEFLGVCARNGGRPALVAEEGDSFRTRTWAEYRRSASEVAMGLRRLGVDHGDHVALMMTNRPEHVIADMGALLAGAVPVSVYNTLAPDQLIYLAGDCGARVAIVEDGTYLQRWLEVREQVPTLEAIVVLDADDVPPDDDRVLSYDELTATGARALAGGQGELENSWRAVDPEDPVTLIYTSGTTGPPKGVVLTHRNLLFQIAANASRLDVETGQRIISYLPLAHIAERMMSHYMGIRYAATAYFVRELPDVLATMTEARPNSFMAVPRVWEKLHAGIMREIHAADGRRRRLALTAIDVGTRMVTEELAGRRPSLGLRARHAVFDRLVFSRIRAGLGLDQLRYAVSGAAPISRDLLIFFAAIGIEILEVYGMTETTAVITANPPGRVRLGTVGTALPGTEVAVAEDGEVLTRGPHLTPGYHRRADATRELIDDDGWLHTGDLGHLDSDGYLTIIGRKKEMIVTAGGKNLSPTNVEEAIKQRSPIIAQLCAVGDERPYVAALVVLDAEALPGWAEAAGVEIASVAQAAEVPEVRREVQRAIDEGNAELSRPEQVRRWALVASEWTAESEELTPSLKLKRAVIHRKYVDVIDGLYGEG